MRNIPDIIWSYPASKVLDFTQLDCATILRYLYLKAYYAVFRFCQAATPTVAAEYLYLTVFKFNCRKYHSPEPSLYTALCLCTHGLSPSPLYTGTCSVGWKCRTSNVTSCCKAIRDSRETCRGRRLQTCIAGSASGDPPQRCYRDDSLYYEFVYHRNDFEAVILRYKSCIVCL